MTMEIFPLLHVLLNLVGMTEMPFFYWSPRQMADIYARTIGTMAEAYAASTRMATNMLFAGMEATRATTNYARHNAKEAARITSNTARTFGRTVRETVEIQEEGERRRRIGGISSEGGSTSTEAAGGRLGKTTGSFESKGGADTRTTTTTYTSEGTTASGGGTGSTTTTTGTTTSLSDTTPGFTDKTRKK